MSWIVYVWKHIPFFLTYWCFHFCLIVLKICWKLAFISPPLVSVHGDVHTGHANKSFPAQLKPGCSPVSLMRRCQTQLALTLSCPGMKQTLTSSCLLEEISQLSPHRGRELTFSSCFDWSRRIIFKCLSHMLLMLNAVTLSWRKILSFL